jgi:hypothetical protein
MYISQLSQSINQNLYSPAHLIFFCPLAYNLPIPPANGKQARMAVAEEIYQTLMFNRKPGHMQYKIQAKVLLLNTFKEHEKGAILT